MKLTTLRCTAWCIIFTFLSACASKPLVPFTTDSAPLALLPAGQPSAIDQRGRFREISCAVLEAHGQDLPHYRSCDEALVMVGDESPGTGKPVDLEPSSAGLEAAFVPGVGWECFGDWLDDEDRFAASIESYGYKSSIFKVDGLSGTETNAQQIRDSIISRREDIELASLVMIGYSKGTPDILTAIVNYPEIRPFIAAVVSLAGAVGGSPLAYDFSGKEMALVQRVLKTRCNPGDGQAALSLQPTARQAWLHDNKLPAEIPYYSLVTYPMPDEVSRIFKGDYKELSRIDPRNDSKLFFYDQVIPGARLLGYLNADHMAVAAPISEEYQWIGETAWNRNAFPRQAIAEAVMRFVEEDLTNR